MEEGLLSDWKSDLPFMSEDDFIVWKQQTLCGTSVGSLVVSEPLLDWVKAVLRLPGPELPLQRHLLSLTSFTLPVPANTSISPIGICLLPPDLWTFSPPASSPGNLSVIV